MLASWFKYGCLGCLGLVIFCIIGIFIFTYHSEKHLFYIEKENMYVLMDRNNGSDFASVYFGKSIEDIEKKLDYFEINRTAWDAHYMTFIKLKNKDSIFITVNSDKKIRIGNSNHFSINVISEKKKRINSYSITEKEGVSFLPDNSFEKKFKDNPSNYIMFGYGWDDYWHEDHILRIYEEYYPANKKRENSIHILPVKLK